MIPTRFTGTLQCDGYSAYRTFANERGEAIELAGWLLRQIQHLYRIEADLREQRAGPTLRQAKRASQSRLIVERLQRALVRLKATGRYLPQSLLGQAIDYTLGQWPTLEVYLNDGRVELDNNLVGNAIRPTTIGKKNWLFIGDAQAGQRSAIIYTLIESCRRRDLDPLAYLRGVLTRLPNMTNRQIPEVTPQAWGKTRQQVQRLASSCRSIIPLTLTIPVLLLLALSRGAWRDAYPLRGRRFDTNYTSAPWSAETCRRFESADMST